MGLHFIREADSAMAQLRELSSVAAYYPCGAGGNRVCETNTESGLLGQSVFSVPQH